MHGLLPAGGSPPPLPPSPPPRPAARRPARARVLHPPTPHITHTAHTQACPLPGASHPSLLLLQLFAFLGVGTTNLVATNSLTAPGLDEATR